MTGPLGDLNAQDASEGSTEPREDLFGMGEVEGGREALHSWMREHQPELQRAAYGDRLLYQALGFCVGLGMVAYVGGYVLRSSIASEPLQFFGDLLYTLG